MLYILNIACGLLVFIVMKTRSFGHPPYVNRFKKMLLQASLRRIFPNPLTHAGLLVDIFNLPVNRLDSILFLILVCLAERSAAEKSAVGGQWARVR